MPSASLKKTSLPFKLSTMWSSPPKGLLDELSSEPLLLKDREGLSIAIAMTMPGAIGLKTGRPLAPCHRGVVGG